MKKNKYNAVCEDCAHFKTCEFVKQFEKKYIDMNFKQRHQCNTFVEKTKIVC